MESNYKKVLKNYNLIQELEIAVSTLKSGLGVLQQSAGSDLPRYFLFMLLLSTGLERLMKVLLCIYSLDKEGKFLEPEVLKYELGHDLVELKTRIENKGFTEEALRRDAMQKDLQFLREDKLLNEIIAVLSDFANEDRYIYLDGINYPELNRKWLDRRWNEIEEMAVTEEEKYTLIREDRLQEYPRLATERIMICFERFLRALARTITLSGLGKEAQSLGTNLWSFLMRKDDQLGETKYPVV